MIGLLKGAVSTVLYHFKTKVDVLGELMSPVVDDYDAISTQIEDLEPQEAQPVVIARYVDLLIRRRHLAGILRLDLPKLARTRWLRSSEPAPFFPAH